MSSFTLSDFVGKEHIIKVLQVGIKASLHSGKSLDHILLYGPPGVGKTTLATAIANELNRKIKIIQGANILEINDLIGVISTLKLGDILFIDEIHTVKKEIAEVLYPVLENKVLDLIIGKNLNKRNIRINLPDFTFIGATTNLGNITKALEERFGYVFYLDSYTEAEIKQIINNSASELGIELTKEELKAIVETSRGIPRNALRILRRVNDYKLAKEEAPIEQIIKSCGFLYKGLSSLDIKYLLAIKDKSCSLTSISQKINLDEKTITNKIEPYMFFNGWIVKTNKGRSLSPKGMEMLKKVNELV